VRPAPAVYLNGIKRVIEKMTLDANDLVSEVIAPERRR
jgi:hypothetical protein